MTTTAQDTAALRTIRETVDALAGRVFGEPIHQNGTTVLPVAAVATGGGGGGGSAPAGKGGKGPADAQNSEGYDGKAGGEGGGFGVVAKPAGAFVIRDGTVSWRPAVDLNRVVMGGQLVAIVGLFVLRSIVKARSKRRHHHHHGLGLLSGLRGRARGK